MRASRRIYIVDEAHGLTAAGGQAFLKLLEEPPGHVLFVLATTDPDRMLHTNRSRCAEFELLPPTREAVVEHLVAVAGREGVVLEATAAAAVAAAADPDLGVRGTLVALDKLLPVLAAGPLDDDELAEILGVPPASAVAQLADAVARRDPSAALSAFASLRHRFPARIVAERVAERFAADLVEVCARPDFDVVEFEAARQRCSAFARVVAAGSEVAAVAAIADLARPTVGAAPQPASPPTRPASDVEVAPLSDAGRDQDPASAAAHDSPIEHAGSSADAAVADASPSEDAAPPAGSATPGTPSTDFAALLAALGARSRLAAAVLRSGEPSSDDATLVVTLAAPALDRLTGLRPALDAAALDVGLTIRLERAVG